MAVEEGLEVQFKGDASGLQKAANDAATALDRVGKTASASSYLARDAINDLSHEFRDLPYALNNPSMLAGPFGKLQALFFDLKQQTGSTEGAFKALGSSIMGGGGLLLAGNLLVSALAILGPKLFSIGEGAKTAGDKFKDLKTSMEQYASSLTPLNQALLKGKQDSEEQIVKLDLLYKATQNTTLSIKDRTKATDDLKKLYPALFQGMSDEVIMNGNAVKSYQSLRTTLLETARAQALLNEAVDLYKQSDAAEAKLKGANEELRKLKENLKSGPQTDLAANTASKVNEAYKERNKLAQEYLDINGQINAIEAKIDPTKVVKPNFNVKLDKEQFIKRIHESIVNDGIPEAFTKELQNTLFNTSGAALDYKPNPEYEKYLQKTFYQIIADTFNPLKSSQQVLVIPLSAKINFIKSKNGLSEDEIKNLTKLVDGTLTPAFENLFTAIEQGKAPLQAFFQSIGQSVEQLISKLVAAAIEALIISAITGNSTTFSSAFSNLSGFNIGKHASGGIAYGPSVGMIGEYANAGTNPEVIAPLSKLKSILGGVQSTKAQESRIDGIDLILSETRSKKYLRRIS